MHGSHGRGREVPRNCAVPVNAGAGPAGCCLLCSALGRRNSSSLICKFYFPLACLGSLSLVREVQRSI